MNKYRVIMQILRNLLRMDDIQREWIAHYAERMAAHRGEV